jgi:hypothetical protein
MRRALLRAALVLYPRRWRERYGQELKDLVDDLQRTGERSRIRLALSVVAGAAQERAVVLRARSARATATVAIVGAVLAAVAVVTVSASSSTRDARTQLRASNGLQPAITSGAEVSYGNPSPLIERQLRADIRGLCTQVAAGKRATAIELNPSTGAIVAKLVQTCGAPA